MNKAQFKKWGEQFNALSEQIRLLILVAVLILFPLVWYYLLASPLNQQAASLSMPLQIAKLQYAQAAKQYDALQTMDKSPNLTNLLQQQKELMTKFAQVKSNPNYSKKQIIPFTKLRGVIESLLSTEPELTLNNMQQDPSTKQLTVEFSGDYFSFMRFFQRLENLPWFFFYDDFEYNVIDYPAGEVHLVLHTLDIKGNS